MALTSKQRAHLRGLAHTLKPLTHVGKEGVTDAVIQSVGQAFSKRELVKIRVRESAPASPRECAELIATAIENVHVVQTVGYTTVLYRPHPEMSKIRLPG